jgi:hypothetical protein
MSQPPRASRSRSRAAAAAAIPSGGLTAAYAFMEETPSPIAQPAPIVRDYIVIFCFILSTLHILQNYSDHGGPAGTPAAGYSFMEEEPPSPVLGQSQKRNSPMVCQFLQYISLYQLIAFHY